jgi:hypothetical protein
MTILKLRRVATTAHDGKQTQHLLLLNSTSGMKPLLSKLHLKT